MRVRPAKPFLLAEGAVLGYFRPLRAARGRQFHRYWERRAATYTKACVVAAQSEYERSPFAQGVDCVSHPTVLQGDIDARPTRGPNTVWRISHRDCRD